MNMKERVSLKGKITKIALNEAMKGWQPPVSGPLHCPFCKSEQVYQRMQRKDGMTHGCKECGQSFSEELVQECRCVRPGKFAKCLSCRYYQPIRELMKSNVEQLRYLPEVEVDQVLNHPDFYKDGFSAEQVLPHITLKRYAERQTVIQPETKVMENLNQEAVEVALEQLSLFD